MELDQQFELFIKTALPSKEGIFFNGEICDAYVFATELIKRANQSLVIIDNYVDESVLVMISKRKTGVMATTTVLFITQFRKIFALWL